MTGRNTKLTPERQAMLCENVSLGLRYKQAALLSGICERTFYYWKRRGKVERERLEEKGARGRKAEVPFLGFLQSLEVANAKAQRLLLARIQQAATDGHWRAAAWILERRYPGEWGLTARVDVTSKDEHIKARQSEAAQALASDGLAALYDKVFARVAGGGDDTE